MQAGSTTVNSAGVRRLTPLLVLETSTLFSGVANGVTMVAFPWLVLELTGSAAAAGAIGAITALPLALSFLFAGAVVDTIGRRRVAVFSDLLSMISVALVPICDATIGLSFGLLAGLAVLGAVFDPAGVSARETVLPEVAAATGLTRERVNGLHEAVWGAAFLVGPGVGGLALGLLGAAPTYWISAGMFALSSLVMMVLRVPGAGRPAAHERPSGILKGTWEGARYIWMDRPLRGMAVISMVVVGVWLPVEGVVLPVHFEALNEPTSLGFSVMAMGLGGVVGALVYSAVGHRWPSRATFGWSILLAGLGVFGMSVFPPLPLFLVFGFASGLAYGPVGPVVNLVMQNRTPFQLRGRVVSMLTSAAYVAGPIGFVMIGPGVQALGVVPVFIAVAVVVTVMGVVALLLPGLRGMNHSRADALDVDAE